MSLINTLTSISTDNDGYKIKLNSFMPYPLRFIQRECFQAPREEWRQELHRY